MGELRLNGYLCKNIDGMLALSDKKPKDAKKEWLAKSVVESIEEFAEKNGFYTETETGLGGKLAYIKNCNLRIWVTKVKCTVEEAMVAFDTILYGGDIRTECEYVGYSEYTITGMELTEFTIGGHNLDAELADYLGKYIHIIIEC